MQLTQMLNTIEPTLIGHIVYFYLNQYGFYTISKLKTNNTLLS